MNCLGVQTRAQHQMAGLATGSSTSSSESLESSEDLAAGGEMAAFGNQVVLKWRCRCVASPAPSTLKAM